MLRSNRLMGFGAFPQPAIVTYRSVSNDTANLTTYTHSSMSLGPTSHIRLIGISVGNSSLRDINSVTVDGVAATFIGKTDASINTVQLWIANPSSNTTGDVVVVLDGAAVRCITNVWSVSGLKSKTAADTGSDNTVTSNALSDSVNIPANGICVAVAYGAGSGNRTTTWTGLNEDFDELSESQTPTAASANFTTARTGETITATFSGAVSNSGLFIASFR